MLLALVCNTCLSIIKSEMQSMTVSAYLALKNDGATLRRIGIHCGIDGCLADGNSVSSPELKLRHIDVMIVSKHSKFVCGKAEHRRVHALAWVTLFAIAVIYPLAIVTFLSARLRYMVQQSRQDKPVQLVVLRRPCVRWKGSCCVRYSVGLCSRTCREPKRTPIKHINNDAQTLSDSRQRNRS
jgi:hypothetical protein